MQERITVMGRVAADPQRVAKDTAPGGPVSFRFATNDSRWDDAAQRWVDGGTNWYTVKAWRSLGDNVLTSVSKGQPLVVHGRLELDAWTDSSGRERVTPTIHADAVGHDLRRGIGSFTPRASEQNGPRQNAAPGSAAAPSAAAPSEAADRPASEEKWADPTDLADLPF